LQVGKRYYLLRCHFTLRLIMPPRQARDKHRGNSKTRCVFLQDFTAQALSQKLINISDVDTVRSNSRLFDSIAIVYCTY
jgi:hypothetical protein